MTRTSSSTRISCAAPSATTPDIATPRSTQLVDQQSMQSDTEKRKQLVWEIERRLAEDSARPIIFYPRSGACWQPQFKGHTMMINGNYNGWRLEDAWLDK